MNRCSIWLVAGFVGWRCLIDPLVRAAEPQPPQPGIWISIAEVSRLPTHGPAWDRLLAEADRPTGMPNLSDQDDGTNVRVMAKALVFARTGQSEYRDDVILACTQAQGTQRGGRTLALGRELAAYVIAADLVGLPPEDDRQFRQWLRAMLDEELAGQTLRSTHQRRPNNWGTHAGASRAAVARYLDDREELNRAATVFHGFLGNRDAYHGFQYGALDWQADPLRPVGINPRGAGRQGHSIDGVLPDDQRRAGGGFRWPPPHENYVYEALQGALVQAVVLSRAGYDVWEWEDRALLRAYRWLYDEARFPAQGDDTWQMHLVNHYYGTHFPATTPARPGKNVGWTDWTHAP